MAVAIGVVLPIGRVVFLVIRHQIIQREAIMAGDEVDAAVRVAVVLQKSLPKHGMPPDCIRSAISLGIAGQNGTANFGMMFGASLKGIA